MDPFGTTPATVLQSSGHGGQSVLQLLIHYLPLLVSIGTQEVKQNLPQTLRTPVCHPRAAVLHSTSALTGQHILGVGFNIGDNVDISLIQQIFLVLCPTFGNISSYTFSIPKMIYCPCNRFPRCLGYSKKQQLYDTLSGFSPQLLGALPVPPARYFHEVSAPGGQVWSDPRPSSDQV